MRSVDTLRVLTGRCDECGDIDVLVASIRTIGLLHPIVVNRNGTLLSGRRRLRACKALGWTQVPVIVTETLQQACALLAAEQEDDIGVVAPTLSERVALGLMLEVLPRAPAPRDDASGRPCTHYPRDTVARAVGMAGARYARARSVVLSAEEDPRLIAAVQEMDRSGDVSPAYVRLQRLTAL